MNELSGRVALKDVDQVLRPALVSEKRRERSSAVDHMDDSISERFAISSAIRTAGQGHTHDTRSLLSGATRVLRASIHELLHSPSGGDAPPRANMLRCESLLTMFLIEQIGTID